MLAPEPRNMARVARGVEMKRVSSAAAGRRLCSGRVKVLHTPSPLTPGPEIATRRPLEMSSATANDSARLMPLLCEVSSRAAA